MPQIPTTEEMKDIGWKNPALLAIHKIGREVAVPVLTNPLTYSLLIIYLFSRYKVFGVKP